jgi:plastocyanin
MNRRAITALVVLAAAALGACGGGSSGGSSGATKTAAGGSVSVVATDTKFDVGKIEASTGSLTVTLENHGALQHTFKIDHTTLLLKASPGKSATGSVTLAKGTYDFECTIPGHKALGMKGTVVVG